MKDNLYILFYILLKQEYACMFPRDTSQMQDKIEHQIKKKLRTKKLARPIKFLRGLFLIYFEKKYVLSQTHN